MTLYFLWFNVLRLTFISFDSMFQDFSSLSHSQNLMRDAEELRSKIRLLQENKKQNMFASKNNFKSMRVS